jgi:Ca-activated chloride channel homolog
MNLLWPGFLLLLGFIPILIAAYIWKLRRRRRFALRYSSLSLVRQAISQQSRWRRHLPFVLFLLASSALIMAISRPTNTVKVPVGRATIILAIDVSRSMCITDISPNRLLAASEAALSFIRRQEPGVEIGVVAFAGFAALVQEPTGDLEALEAAINGLSTGRRTAIGSAIITSVNAITEFDSRMQSNPGGQDSIVPPSPVLVGQYVPHIVVVLTDGVSNSGPVPLDAAQHAVDRGIRVYTIGFGTDNENQSIPYCNPSTWSFDQFDGGGGFGGGGGSGQFRRGIDEETLIEVASITGGEYFPATSAGELQAVFDNLPSYLHTREEHIEISAAFAAIGALLAAIAIGLSLRWNPMP